MARQDQVLRRVLRPAPALALLLGLAGCDLFVQQSSPYPRARPPGLTPPPVVTAAPRSVESAELVVYYGLVAENLQAEGKLRTDDGADIPVDPATLAQNFERIAFYEEYTRGRPGGPSPLSRWEGPVRVGTEFGPSVQVRAREHDQREVESFTRRLAGITGHSITNVSRDANFIVFFASLDDADFLQSRLTRVVPGITDSERAVFRDLPRSYYCLVLAMSAASNPYVYDRAVVLVRAEHPQLVRSACIHEEIAQGLGLPNDSPQARPSIFNDDDEFALLTHHDEMLLQMLYDKRLRPGMTADEARHIVRMMADELVGPRG